MPTLEVDVGHDVLEARVTFNSARLVDVLRLLVDQSNHHEEEIQRLRTALERSEGKVAELEQKLAQVKPEEDRMATIEASISANQSAIERLRVDSTNRMDSILKTAKLKYESYDGVMERLQGHVDSAVANIKITSREAAETVDRCQRQIHALVIPDIAPLEKAIAELSTFRSSAGQQLESCSAFFHCWVDAVNAQKIKHLPDEALARTAFVMELPPMIALKQAQSKLELQLQEKLKSSLSEMTSIISAKVDKHELGDLANAFAEKNLDTKRELQFLERRFAESINLGARCAAIEQKIAEVRSSQADQATAIQLQSSCGSMFEFAQNLKELQSDVGDLVKKVERPTLSGREGIIVGGVAQRVAFNDANLADKFAHLDEAIASLEVRKADKTEVSKLHELVLDAISMQNAPKQTLPRVSSASSAQLMLPHVAAQLNKTQQDRTTGNSPLAPHHPRTPLVTSPHRKVDEKHAGRIAGQMSDLQESSEARRSVPLTFPKKELTPKRAADRTDDTVRHYVDFVSPLPNDGELPPGAMSGTSNADPSSLPASVESRRVLGRGVAVVRDSMGSVTAAEVHSSM